jgi:glycosyltransferase involved in cell wall biosynthesis
VRILLVTGIWPPDMGGPATHMPEVADFLHARGHDICVCTTANKPPDQRPYSVEWIPRSLPGGVRHLAMARRVARYGRTADVVYATSVPTRAAMGSALARTPLVLKLTTDDAFERASRLGWFTGDMDRFQQTRGPRVGVLRRMRGAAVRHSAAVVCPSRYLAGLVHSWGVSPERVLVIPNAGPRIGTLPSREDVRARLPLDGCILIFAGRIAPQKALDVALEAIAQVPEVTLLVIGEGPDRPHLQARAAGLGLGTRVQFLGAYRHERVLELLRAADASLLSSDWENAPHGVVESLAVGTPVIATAVGGVPEIVKDGVNGLLVPPRDPAALAAAIRRITDEPGLRNRLAAGSPPSVEEYAPEHVLERLTQTLATVAAGHGTLKARVTRPAEN